MLQGESAAPAIEEEEKRDRQMSDAKAVVQGYIDMFRKRRAAATLQMDRFLAPGYVHPFDTGQHLARDEYESVFSKFYIAFPDFDYEPLDIISEGDGVAVRFNGSRDPHR